jgi:hypothetical protein
MSKKLLFIMLSIFVMTAGLTAQTDPGTDNLDHHWSFDDGSTTDTGTVGGVDGVLMGNCAVVDGSLVLTDPADPADYVIPSAGTGEAWMELDGASLAILVLDEMTMTGWYTSEEGANTSFHMLCYFGDSNENGVGNDGLFYSPARQDDKSRIAISCGEPAQPWTAETGVDGPEIDDGVLHHFAGVFTAVDVSYYLDGVLQGDSPVPMADNNTLYGISTNYAWLGRGGYTGDWSWQGSIHDFRIYSRGLTDDEVLFLALQDPFATSVDAIEAPAEFALSQNYPNPFNPTTDIAYSVRQTGQVTLTVFDVLGRTVGTLVNETLNPGEYVATFNAHQLSGGVYYYQLKSSSGVITKKMVLMK